MTTVPACPRCEVALFPGHAPDATLWGCSRCGGVWADTKTSWLVARALLSPEARALASQAGTRARPRNAYRSKDTASATATCPTCRRALTRGHAAEGRIEVDLCAEHGTWFDPGEIAAVLSALEASRSVADTRAATDDPDDFKRTPDQIVVALFSLFAGRGDDRSGW